MEASLLVTLIQAEQRKVQSLRSTVSVATHQHLNQLNIVLRQQWRDGVFDVQQQLTHIFLPLKTKKVAIAGHFLEGAV